MLTIMPATRDLKYRPKIRTTQAAGIAFCLFVYCNAAVAEVSTEPGAQMFSFSGFGTLGVVHSSEKRADYVANDLQARGAGRSANWSMEVDSRIGAQATARLTSDLTGIVQVTSEQRSDGSYKPEVEWANLKYQVTPDFSIRVGRVVLPTFLVSDYRMVGYANPWVRPPVEVYSLIPVTRSDGVDTTYRLQSANMTHTLQAGFGRSSASIPTGGNATANRGWRVSDTIESGALTVNLSFAQGNLNVDGFETLFNGLRRFGLQGNGLANKYDPNEKRFRTMGVGAIYDPGKWFIMGEYSLSDSKSILGKRAGWYLSSGYRHGKWTPYLTFAQARVESNRSDPGLSLAGLPASAAATAAALNAGLNGALQVAPVQDTVALGVRWDFASKAALKLQYDHTRIKSGSSGTLNNAAPDFKPGGNFNVVSATVDFLF